jgi:tetratricopeptide (TPR) repeat protein
MKLFAPPHLALLVVGLFASGCGRPLPPTTVPGKVIEPVKPSKLKLVMEPIQLQAVKGSPNHEVEVLDAGLLFERGSQLLSSKHYKRALKHYNRLLTHFPTSRYVSPTLYNAGLCHEWLGQFGKAAQRYKKLINRAGQTKEAVDAGFRLGGAYAELHNWPASAQVFQVLLSRKDLSATDRIEALSRKGLAHFRLGDHRSCKSTLRTAVRYHKQIEAVERLDTDFFIAMAHYYLAALPHVDFRKLEVKPGKQMAKTLDEKARFLLLSQAAYIRAIKVKNPYWATAAGFQVGSLYKEFYRVLLTTLPDFSSQARQNAKRAKIPVKQAQTQLVQVYLEEVHKAVKPLLHKAIRVFEKNVLMAERVGVQSNWVGKSRRQVQELKHLLTLPPKDAIDLVKRDDVLPEDTKGAPQSQPAKDPTKAKDPARDPAKPVVPGAPADEPGRVIL